jgi:hypothetical protein
LDFLFWRCALLVVGRMSLYARVVEWQTRRLEVPVPQGVEVRLLSRAPQKNTLLLFSFCAPPKNSSKKEKKVFLLGSALSRGRRVSNFC